MTRIKKTNANTIYPDDVTITEIDNALIDAAPKLLKACKRATELLKNIKEDDYLNWTDGDQEVLEYLETVIAEATG